MENNQRDARRNLIIAVLLFVFLVIVVYFSFRGGDSKEVEQELRFVSVTPVRGAIVDPDQTTVSFEFSEQLPLIQPDAFSITVSPEVEYIYGIVNNTLNINLSDLLLLDDVTYDIQIDGLVDQNERVYNNIGTQFTVGLSDQAAALLGDLPHVGNGFIIRRVSDYVLFVDVTKKPFGDYLDIAHRYLSDRGIDETKFNLDFAEPEDQNKGDIIIDFH